MGKICLCRELLLNSHNELKINAVMATQFFIKPIEGTTDGKIYARVRRKTPAVDAKLATEQVFPVAEWREYEAGMDAKSLNRFRAKYKTQWGNLDAIKNRLESAVEDATDSKTFAKDGKRIIHEIVDAEAIEMERKAQEEQARKQAEEDAIRKAQEERKRANDFMEYYADFCDRAESGKATKIGKGAGIELSERSKINYRQGYRWLCEYQEKVLGGRGISFDDVDKAFFDDYAQYLRTRTLQSGKNKGKTGCTQNTISMRIAELKTILRRANEVDEKTTNDTYRNKSIKVDDVEIDDIALTRKELDTMCAVDLSGLPKCYEIARDIFMIGVLTAQRVSDYNGNKDGGEYGIRPEDIKTYESDIIVKDEKGNKSIETIETQYITIRQRKTGKRVEIPVNSELKGILSKYDFCPPFLWEQKLNVYIKTIAEKAGLTDKVKITTMRGGKKETAYIEKYKLIHSHTARKTGATLMYQAGIDVYDIMKITGHSDVRMLEKYVKAGNGETAHRIASKYDYFK